MALLNPPAYMQNGTYTARDDRLFLDTIVPTAGVERGFTVTQTPTSSMYVRVTGGRAFVKWTSTANQGSYLVTNDGNIDVPIAAASSANPRKDRVVLTIRDAQFSGSNNDAIIQVLQGDPAGTPNPPVLPANSITLAVVTVPKSASVIVTANVDNSVQDVARISATLAPQAIKCTSTTRPTSNITDGMIIQETDTGLTRVRVGSVWRLLTGEVSANGVLSAVLASNGTGWNVTSANADIRGTALSVYINATYTGSGITVPSTGNIVNQLVCTIKPTWAPALTTGISSTGTGRTIGGYVNPSGQIYLANVAPGANIAKNETFSMAFTGIVSGSTWQV